MVKQLIARVGFRTRWTSRPLTNFGDFDGRIPSNCFTNHSKRLPGNAHSVWAAWTGPIHWIPTRDDLSPNGPWSSVPTVARRWKYSGGILLSGSLGTILKACKLIHGASESTLQRENITRSKDGWSKCQADFHVINLAPHSNTSKTSLGDVLN